MTEENKRFDDEHLCKTYELLNTPKFRNYVYDFDGKGNYCEYIDEYEVKIDELQTQLQQKENIIKEVREYIKEHSTTINFKTMRADYNLNMNELLEILDKEEVN